MKLAFRILIISQYLFKVFYVYRLELIIILFLFISGQTNSQVVLNNESTKDMALVARGDNNKGIVHIKGIVDNSSDGYNFDKLVVKVFKSDRFYEDGLNIEITNLQRDIPLIYINGIASFEETFEITAELKNYSFEIWSVKNNVEINTSEVIKNVVAGDVYVIQGQSNALAERKPVADPDDHTNENIFIRTFGSPRIDDAFLDYLIWYQAKDFYYWKEGHIGQWGLKLGHKIVTNKNIPVAIINGAQAASKITYFLKNSAPRNPKDKPNLNYNIYNRLLIRLDSAGVKDDVKAIFWCQGESDPNISIQQYFSTFEDLKDDWTKDYQSLEKIYIYQNKSGCSETIGLIENLNVKEAQRRIAAQDPMIHLMQTEALDYYENDTYHCHFTYLDGFEEFANRVYKLVDRDFYGSNSYTIDIEPPMVTDAYLTDETTLVVETDAISLFVNNSPPTDFMLNNAITGTLIENFSIDGNKVLLSLNQYPGNDPLLSLTNKGLRAGENQDNFIVNTEGLEMVCFNEFPINVSNFTVWNGNVWSNNTPVLTINAIIDGTYNASDGNIIAKNLTVKSNKDLNFDGGTTNSVVVYGDLKVDGEFVVGDTESLLIKNVNANVNVTGSFSKKEKTTELDSEYDVTYWSSPVEGASFNSIFTGVNQINMFYYDSKNNNPNYTGTYDKYRHWFKVNPSDNLQSSIGYSITGKNNINYPAEIEFSFIGKPNYKDIDVIIGSSSSDDIDKSNLIGNPYPTAISANDLISLNSGNFDGTLYFWSHKTNYSNGEYNQDDYETYNFMGSDNSEIASPYYIGSGQGFIVLTDKTSTHFSFRNSLQVEDKNNMFFKNNKIKKPDKKSSDKIWLSLSKGNQQLNEILIGFTKGATDKIDFGYDAISQSVVKNKIYSVLNDKKFSIQGLKSFNKTKKIDVGVDISDVGEYSISISKLQGKLKENDIFITDRLLGITHDLKQSNYYFNQNNSGEFMNRFELVFYKKSLRFGEPIVSDGLIISKIPDGFNISANINIESVKIYDIFGRLLFEINQSSKTYNINLDTLKKGTVIVFRIQLENGVVLNKKKINR